MSGNAGEIVFNRTYDTANNNQPIDRYYIATGNYDSVKIWPIVIYFKKYRLPLFSRAHLGQQMQLMILVK